MKNDNQVIALAALTDMHSTWNKGKNVHHQLVAIRRKSGAQVSEAEQFSLDEDKDGKISKVKSTVNAKFTVELEAAQQSSFGSGSKKALAFFYALNRTLQAAGGSADVLFAAFRMEDEAKAAEGRNKAAKVTA